MPPDLSRPYTTEADRANAREALLLYSWLIEVLVRLADQAAKPWSAEQEVLFPASLRENPARRLSRWITTFGDEIEVIGDVRNRMVHAGTVTDPELRGAEWLARQIISTLFDMQPSEINPIWARQTLARAAREVV